MKDFRGGSAVVFACVVLQLQGNYTVRSVLTALDLEIAIWRDSLGVPAATERVANAIDAASVLVNSMR